MFGHFRMCGRFARRSFVEPLRRQEAVMLRLARLSIRHPRLALAQWVVVAAVLCAVGVGVDSALSPTITTVPGTGSARAERLATARFGPGTLVPILLEGPAAKLDRRGPTLVRVLARRPDTRVLSA